MQTRRLGQTDLHLTVLGFGAWQIGGPWEWGWPRQDDRESVAAIHRALELGINWIDTAPAYGLGHSEEVVGQAIRGRRDEVIVATKCGFVWDEAGKLAGKLTTRLRAPSVRREAEESLRRLGVDVIDLYQIHWPEPETEIEEGWSEIARLVEAGKIRYAGVSNFSVAQIRRMQAIHPVVSLQPPYNLLDRNVERELLPFCAAHGIGVVAYSPMASGLLTGKYTRESIASLPADDWRQQSADFQEPAVGPSLDLVEKLRPLARRHNGSVGQLAAAWVLRRAEVTAAIVGVRSAVQITEAAQAADWVLTQEELAEIEALLKARDAALAHAAG